MIRSDFSPLITVTLCTLLLVGCGGGGSGSNTSASDEEQITETTERGEISLQGTVLRFAQFQRSDGTRINASTAAATNFVFLAPFQETYRAEFGCAATTGSYVLDGNTLRMTEQTRDAIADCPTMSSAVIASNDIAQRVMTGPSEISVFDGQLMLTRDTNEALVFVADAEG